MHQLIILFDYCNQDNIYLHKNNEGLITAIAYNLL